MKLREHIQALRKLGSSRSGLVVCLVLVALLAIMQVPHLHQNPADADHCVLCVVMHSAAPAAAPIAAVVLVQIGIPVPAAKTRTILRYWHPQFFTRPPPSSLLAA